MERIRIIVVGRHQMLVDALRFWAQSVEHFELEDKVDDSAPPWPRSSVSTTVVCICALSMEEVEPVRHWSTDPGSTRVAVVCDPSVVDGQLGALADSLVSVIGFDVTRSTFVHMIDLIANGAIILSDAVTNISATCAHRDSSSPDTSERDPNPCPEKMRKIRLLTKREVQILTRLSSRRTNREIAEELNLSEKTIRNYVSNVLAKLNVNTRLEAGDFAASISMVPAESDRLLWGPIDA